MHASEELEKVCPFILKALQETPLPTRLFKDIYEFVAKFNEPYLFCVEEIDKGTENCSRQLVWKDVRNRNNTGRPSRLKICRWCSVLGNHSEMRSLLPITDWRNEGWGKHDYNDYTDVIPDDWRPWMN
jgi:hypothetical protein